MTRNINTLWEEFKKAGVAPDVSEDQLNDMKTIFFAGAMLFTELAISTESPDEVTALCQHLRTESKLHLTLMRINSLK